MIEILTASTRRVVRAITGRGVAATTVSPSPTGVPG